MLVNKLLGSVSQQTLFEGFIGIGSSVTMNAFGCAITDDSLYVCGQELQTIRPGFLVKLDYAGDLVWQRKLTSGSNLANANNLIVNSNGDIYVLLTCGSSLENVALVKYDASGALQWQRKLTHSTANLQSSLTTNSLALDSSGNVYCMIQIQTADIEPVLLKYNSSGTLQWQKGFYSSGTDYAAAGFALDSSDNIYALIGDGATANNRCTIKKLNSSGTLQSSKFLSGLNHGSTIICNGTDLFVLGGASGTAKFIKYNTSLVYQNSREISSTTFYFGTAGFSGNEILAANNSSASRKYIYGTTTPAITNKRVISTSFSGGSIYKAALNSPDGFLVAAGGSYLTNGSYHDAYLMVVPSDNDIGTYTPMSIANDTTSDTAGTEPASYTSSMLIRDASIVDAAGDLTDAAASYTVNLYPRV